MTPRPGTLIWIDGDADEQIVQIALGHVASMPMASAPEHWIWALHRGAGGTRLLPESAGPGATYSWMPHEGARPWL